MAVGTTDSWVATRDEIIADALANLGVVGPGEEATGKPRAHAARALDALVKSIDAAGQFLWRTSRLTTTTVASQANYTLSALALDVDDPVRYTKSGETTGTILTPMTRDEYMALPDRTITADRPSRYYVEKTLSGGRTAMVMYLYPEPEDASDTIEYAASLRAKDFNDGSTNPDFPSAWTNCLKFGLTALLAPTYKQPGLVSQYMKLFEAEKAAQLGNDNEKQGITLVAFGGCW